MNSFKVGVRVPGQTEWVFNGLRFGQQEQAERYAQELLIRWRLVKEVFVAGSDDPPNATYPVPDSTYKVKRPEDQLKFTPREIDIEWAKQMVALINDGGVLTYPSTRLVYRLYHKRKTMVLMNPDELINVDALIVHLRTVETWAVIGWTVEGYYDH